MLSGWKSKLEATLPRAWAHRGIVATLLWPLSLIYGTVFQIRRTCYQLGIFQIKRVNATVIVVGNAIAGGAGKTPTVIEVARHLRARGKKVGVISRGYGSRHTNVGEEVLPHSVPQHVGDEPVLIRHKTMCPVFVGRHRDQVAAALLDKYPDTEIIISDDGLQHYGLWRDVEVCVFDNRGVGNGWQLPAGPLRESWPRKFVLNAGQHANRSITLHTGDRPTLPGMRAYRRLATQGIRKDGSTVVLASLCGAEAKPLAAVAAIAQPSAFFTMLIASGLPIIQSVALPDHYDFDSFNPSEFEGKELICTEKDAVKLWQHVPHAIAVPLVQECEPAFWERLDTQLQQISSTKL